jgi:hypothetical protein
VESTPRWNASRLGRWVVGFSGVLFLNEWTAHLRRRGGKLREDMNEVAEVLRPMARCNINIVAIHCLRSSHACKQVTNSTTQWRLWRLTTLTDDPKILLWWPMWLHLMTPDDPSDDQKTTLMTSNDFSDDPWWL